MSNIIVVIILFLTLYICATITEKKQVTEVTPLQYVTLDASKYKYTGKVYVPVNLHGKRRNVRSLRKTILKIRNTSFSDSIYISRVECYDKQGMRVQSYIDSTLLVIPMATAEIPVRGKEFTGSGDNFIVQWHSNDSLHKPIIQVVGLDTENRVVATEHGTLIH